ncbi:MAG: deoxyribonuclease IV [Deltaproteobacteria bacterium]|nr:deoxyribonuclease IV [Deltaproteobacteria bacterium]
MAKLLGAHMSIAGGVERAPGRGKSVGCEIIQLFTKNSNQWNDPVLSKESAAKFRGEMKANGIKTAFAHDSYLINLGSPNANLYQRSLGAFIEEHKRSEALGLMGVVFHPGAHVGSGEETAIKKIAAAINVTHEKTPDFKVLTLLENAAGQGSTVGHRFEHLAAIMEKVKEQKRIGVCFDTQHAFAAGYDLRTGEGYAGVWEEFDRIVGIKWLRAFHLNDSKKELGARVDRHEHIGKGLLGLTAFKCLMNDKRFDNIPMSLETPKSEDCHEDKEALDLLRSL